MQTTTTPARFSDRTITFANGSVGESIVVPSANPRNYHQPNNDADNAPPAAILDAFFDADALRAWWQVSRSVCTPRPLGSFALEWESTRSRDEPRPEQYRRQRHQSRSSG